MFQVRIHGRGGQGVVSAAEINSVMRFLGDDAANTVRPEGCGICVSECPCGAIKMVPEVS